MSDNALELFEIGRLAGFARAKADDLRQAARSRTEAAAAWRDMTPEKAGITTAIASRMAGRRIKRGNPGEWQRCAECQERIAVAHLGEAATYDGIAARLDELAALKAGN